MIQTFLGEMIFEDCIFQALNSWECPSDSQYEEWGEECSSGMGNGMLCEADQTLPDGTYPYDINNCPGDGPGDYDVFRCLKGKITSLEIG